MLFFKLAPSAIWRFEWVHLTSLCKSLKTKNRVHNWIDFSSKLAFKIWGIYIFHWPDSRFGYGSIDQGAQSSVETFNTVTLHRLFHTVTWRKTDFHDYMSFSVMWTDGNVLHPDHPTWYTWKTPILHFYLNIISKGKCDKLKHGVDFPPKTSAVLPNVASKLGEQQLSWALISWASTSQSCSQH